MSMNQKLENGSTQRRSAGTKQHNVIRIRKQGNGISSNKSDGKANQKARKRSDEITSNARAKTTACDETEIAELRKANAEIPDLKRKLAEFESEKVELKARLAEALRQAMEESKKRDAENAELKTRIEELEKNKADSSAENVRRDDAIAELKAEVVKLRDDNEGSNQVTFPLPCIVQKPSPPSTSPMTLEESISGERGCVVIIPDNSSEVFEFSDSKTVKKLRDQQQDKEARSHKKKEVENIVQDVFDFTMDESDKNHMAKFSLTGRLDKSVDEIMIKEKVGMKKAKGQIYNFILAHNPGTRRNTLYQRINRARSSSKK
ncbi:unnamed protein product [Rhizophagus irregularis]|nr:unnamed protein product [Rhizophagus irregularis]